MWRCVAPLNMQEIEMVLSIGRGELFIGEFPN